MTPPEEARPAAAPMEGESRRSLGLRSSITEEGSSEISTSVSKWRPFLVVVSMAWDLAFFIGELQWSPPPPVVVQAGRLWWLVVVFG